MCLNGEIFPRHRRRTTYNPQNVLGAVHTTKRKTNWWRRLKVGGRLFRFFFSFDLIFSLVKQVKTRKNRKKNVISWKHIDYVQFSFSLFLIRYGFFRYIHIWNSIILLRCRYLRYEVWVIFMRKQIKILFIYFNISIIRTRDYFKRTEFYIYNSAYW